jgi:hypothetical protein
VGVDLESSFSTVVTYDDLLQWLLTSANRLKDPGYHKAGGFIDHDPNYPGQLRDYHCETRF